MDMEERREGCPACGRQKRAPRGEAELRQLKNRLSRMAGQLAGIGKMLDENRYCGDILIQIAAVEKALQAFGYVILQDHMRSCMADDIREGREETIDEVVELIRKLK